MAILTSKTITRHESMITHFWHYVSKNNIHFSNDKYSVYLHFHSWEELQSLYDYFEIDSIPATVKKGEIEVDTYQIFSKYHEEYTVDELLEGRPGHKKVEDPKLIWCRNWIKARFTKHHAFPGPNAGIEVNHFWKEAEKSGLYKEGEYGSAMSRALRDLCRIEEVRDKTGKVAYWVFMPKDWEAFV